MSIATHDNRLAVVELATGMGAKTIVEVGVRRGRLSILLVEIPTLEHLYLIDVWLPERATTQNQNKNSRSVKRWAHKRNNVTVLHMRSDEAATGFEDGSIDFVYIDGDHSTRGVAADIKNYRPKIRTGGIISGDDYDLPEVRAVVDRYIPDRHVHSNGRLWWSK